MSFLVEDWGPHEAPENVGPMAGMADWTPEDTDPAKAAGSAYVGSILSRARGKYRYRFLWYDTMVEQAFWEGVKWQRDRETAEVSAMEPREGETLSADVGLTAPAFGPLKDPEDCLCRDRDGSCVCASCYSGGWRGHM